MLKVGLILYSVRDEMAKDAIDTVKKVGELGYKYIETCNHNAINDPGCVSDGTLWEGQIALYFRWTCLPDCAVPELDADYRRNNRRLS